MGSTRLPGKSIMDIAGKPLVARVIERVKQAAKIDDVVVAIPEEKNSNELISAIETEGVMTCVTPGDPNDLLYRYDSVASFLHADVVVRIPADNPCIDPDEIDRIIVSHETMPRPVGKWLTSNLDRNILGNGYPGGVGAEVYDAWFIHWLDMNVEGPELREHPHFWPMANGRVRTIPCPSDIKRPELHFDVNTLADLEYVRSIYDAIGDDESSFRTRDIINYLDHRELN